MRIARAGLTGMETSALARETGMDGATLERVLETLATNGEIARVDGERALGRESVERLEASLLETLDAHHASAPLEDGMPRAALANALPENVPRATGSALLDRLTERGDVEVRSERVARAGFTAHLAEEEEAIAERLAARFADAALDAPTWKTVVEETGEPEARLRALAHFLERRGRLVAAPDDLFFDRASVVALVERVVAHFVANDTLDTQDFKAMIGTSRRTAVPLMALLDDLQITRRDGSVRRLHSAEPRWKR